MRVAEIPKRAKAFSRRMYDMGDYRIGAESVCDYCGLRIIGGITGALRQLELAHRLNCAPIREEQPRVSMAPQTRTR